MLYECQQRVIDKAGERAIFGFDVGEGKTITSIYHYLKWRRRSDTMLIVFTPKAKVLEGGWEREIARVELAEGIKIPHSIRTTDSIKNLTLKEVMYSAFILDECHMFKAQSQRGLAFVELMNKCLSSVCLLSATPASNGWEDCKNYFAGFGHYELLNIGKRNHKLEYKPEYVRFRFENIKTKDGKGKRFRVVDGYKKEDVLQSIFESFMFTLDGFDKAQLPPRTFQDVTFKRTPLYNAIQKQRVRVLSDGTIEELDTPGALCHTLRKESNPHDKLEYLQMLFEGTDKNIVVFYIYTEHLAQIKALAESCGKDVYEISGKKKEIPSADIKKSVVLVQYQAGGAGIELPMCTITVMFSPTYSYQDYVQALGRNYGGFRQTEHVHVYQFVCDGIEQEIYDALNNKKDFSEKLFASKMGTV